MDRTNLRVTGERLTDLANDLDDMQGYLDSQVKRMDAVVDKIEAGWRGPAAKAYRDLHRGAAEDAVRIREVMKTLEEAVRLSKGGFSAHDLEIMERFRKIQSSVDIAAEASELSTPNPDAAGAAPPKPQSRISDL
ncbi:WXG100 family type VII secretion target [Streptomyces lunaelactis]|uniref:WXG100 family type VII secretion target n=1 Tax=Streptomyces lunaelactis TaxID=1535768 RepID=UPI002676B370|nr:WXG100 family type VII secretion target [Streptomyces lunaelactis]